MQRVLLFILTSLTLLLFPETLVKLVQLCRHGIVGSVNGDSFMEELLEKLSSFTNANVLAGLHFHMQWYRFQLSARHG
ncbi:hypothetical protein BCR43DRAFT_486423 [Syncephalastrum racemosum]|uniref:Secreted protein n=1 Tax=Syncephalastrum racemosum TaxID=13706 RepID=A0A1X2HQF4_SYNRA|nr:hypothetical protein BCR43DRAFT_486423 [Syncephalastrum racemosum]